MASLHVRNVDDVVARLRRAKVHGRSVEAEHREILKSALNGSPSPGWIQKSGKDVLRNSGKFEGSLPPPSEILCANRGMSVEPAIHRS